MKKAFIIILSLIITSCFAACGQASSSKPTAKAKRLFSETTSEQKDLATDYTLDKEISFGDIKLSVDNSWNSVPSGDDIIVFKPQKTLSLNLNKTEINSELLSEKEVFEIHSEPKATHQLTDESYEMVAGNKVLLFTHKPVSDNSEEKYSRHIVFVVNNYSYDIYTQGENDDQNSCDKILSDVFGTLNLPFKDNLHHNATTAESVTETPTETPSETPTETPTEKSTEKPTETINFEYQNAIKKAESYLSHSAFSKDKLYSQLIYEKFSEEASNYAVNNITVDWNVNALKKAESYMSHSAFSKARLYDQLLYEKFTEEQAQYAIDNINADWKESAVKKAQSYLSHSSFSKDRLYNQLIYEKYTPEEAQYAVDKVYN